MKYFIAAFLGAALYCEWAIYVIQPQYWEDLKCTEQDSTCTKILFIADPQIQGDTAVPPPISYLFNWDSDRYLKSTFKVVLKHFKPDVLVYLGDLMDEGSISSMTQFHGYVKRLASIFDVDYDVVQVWIPGDNDIGGENEMIHQEKVEEFEKVFQQPPVIHFRNVSFYKVNAITYTYPQSSKIEDAHENNIRIVVSHYPVTLRRQFGSKVYNAIHPNIFFCAHEHESKYVEQRNDLSERKTTWLKQSKNTFSLTLNDDSLFEVYVPTCSYRMGTNYIGYGAAILENNNQHMRYTVFWSPTRFPYLFLYLFILFILTLYSLVFFASRLLYLQPKKGIRADMSPLLERM